MSRRKWTADELARAEQEVGLRSSSEPVRPAPDRMRSEKVVPLRERLQVLFGILAGVGFIALGASTEGGTAHWPLLITGTVAMTPAVCWAIGWGFYYGIRWLVTGR